MPNPVITDYEKCDDNLVPGVGMEVFDLSTKTAEIANGLAGVTVTYYDNQSDAITQTNPLPNFYTNTSSPQQIWINIRNNATTCNSVSSFNLVVHPLPSAVAPPPMFQCSNGVSNQALFNLSLNNATASNGVPGTTVTYYNSQSDAQNETGAISSTSYLGTDNEIVYIRVEDDTTGCASTTTLLLRVTQGPLVVNPNPQQRCDPNNDGFEVFNLEDSTNEIAGGVLPPGVTVTYHETQTDAITGANPLTSPYSNINPWTQPIYVRVFYTLTGCPNYTTLQLIVNPTPEAITPPDYHTCDDNYDGIAIFDLTTRINQVLGSINPATHAVTFYTSLINAQAPLNAIVNITNYQNTAPNTQTIWVRVENIATHCFDIVTLQLVVDPLPNAPPLNYPQYSLCDTTAPIGYEVFDLGSTINGILSGQTGMNVTFHFSQADANADANALPLLYQNIPIYVQTLWVRVENASTGCFVISTMDIRVEPLPTPVPPTQPYTVCDDNQDGLASFNLNSLTADILQGTTGYTITYHETLTDAELGNNPLASPYQNITPFVQFIYVRAEDILTRCVSVITIELNADPSPVMLPMTLTNLTNCDQDSNTQNSSTVFDLTQETAAILAAQSGPASDYTVTYHVSQTDAQAGVPVIISPANYTNISQGQTIWARVENNATGCYNIGSFQLFVNAPLLLTTPTPLSICDNDTNPNDLYTTFDLTVKSNTISQNLAGYTVTYYPSYPVTASSVAIANPTAYINTIAAVQTLGVEVISPQGCKSYTTLDIRVLPIPTPKTDPPALAPKCDDNNPGDMMEVFNLTVNAAYIINNDPNVTLHYYPSYTDAVNNTLEILNPTTALVGQNVWIRVENNRVDYLGHNCYMLVEQPLTVNPLPTVVQAPTLLPYYACDNDADGITYFDLQTQIENLLGTTQAPADYTVSFYATALGANPITNTGEAALPLTNYQNVIPFQEDVYVRIVNNTTGCVNPAGVLRLIVEEAAVANAVTTPAVCDDYNNQHDGVIQIDLTSFEPTVLGAQNPAVFLVSYYHTQAAAEAGVAGTEITNPTTYETAADDDTIWIRVTNSATTSPCHDVTPLVIHIERYADPTIVTQNDVHTICVDYNSHAVIRPLLLEANNPIAGTYTYQWFENNVAIPGATTPTYLVNTEAGGATRIYTVEMTSAALGCAFVSPTFDVIQSGPAVIPAGTTGYTVTNAFEQNQVITVDILGYGTYQYSLDDGPRQDSNVFENVNLGMHTITVWDTEGGLIYSCDNLTIENVSIIDYPHYFTPNGDGIHDTWNIVGLGGQPSAKIYIFDRYGKLLKQISSTGAGWDGTFNGKLLPSTDYWFTVDFAEGLSYRQFKAHFSLKR
jgi:gliding motility-associated-like protein